MKKYRNNNDNKGGIIRMAENKCKKNRVKSSHMCT